MCVVLDKLDFLKASVEQLEKFNRRLTALIAHNIYHIYRGKGKGPDSRRIRPFQTISPKSKTPGSPATKSPAEESCASTDFFFFRFLASAVKACIVCVC